ncbi:hypothetical protein [Streptomyces sp. NPDC051132]
MSDAQEKEPSHPLEQVTGEKDVPPEEEEGARSQSTEDDGSAGAEDTSAE